jgi:asparagine synthase (glutamine-hydrolysing)
MAGHADEELVRVMTGAVAHRGPDGEGVRAFPSRDGSLPAALGHRRLSIIDPTERGAQPMSWQGGRYWITYNGELYNFRELRSELEAKGDRFASDCDTEVILAMYARHGAGMLPRLNGIFAFAIWDDAIGELFMARDRLGVKPLYWTRNGGVLYFASEVKSLLPAMRAVRLNERVLPQYLSFLWVPDPDTMFESVNKLPPGHWARFAGGELEQRQFWDWTFAEEERPDSAWIDDVRGAVSAAVRRQLVSDVPVGAFLSGGLDSSAIVAEMAAGGERVSTFTVGARPEDLAHDIIPDDVRYARQMAAEVGADYHERILDARITDLLPKLVWHMDEPVADPAAITTYLICAAARERMTVVLSGMGGDEVFAGYPRHLAARLGRYLDVLPPVVRAQLRRQVQSRLTIGGPGRLRGPRRNALKFVRGLEDDWRERYLTHVSYYRADEVRRVLSPELLASHGAHDPFERHRGYFDRVRDEDWLHQILYVDLKTFLPCLNLTYTDKMSMAASTEVRVPLLDNEILDLTARMPARLKLRGRRRKWVLKQSQESKLPHEIIWRPKAGFSAPVRAWLVGDLKPMVDEVLSPANVRARGLFDPDEVTRLVRANADGREDNALRIWALLTLELWQEAFTDRTHRAAPTAVTG